ncbi:ATP-binding protein [Candidatus Neptunochlamydia vexilliferae]|nr:ATP-binding protein [Candidatus Neptunochlamydia vexilliferae]
MDKKASFTAELASLHPILNWVGSHLEKTSFSDVEVRRIELALEEGIVNIISYAYQGTVGMIDVSFHSEEGKYVELTFEDSGEPFNPLTHKKERDPFVPIEEMEIGGLGIHFMKELMDKVEYKREGDKNTLRLQKKLPKD